jgi:hypothetical protein
MAHPKPLQVIALGPWLAVAQTAIATQCGGQDALPSTLVTAEVIGARITEAEVNPELRAEARTKLVALYREALSTVKGVDASGARAAAFEEAARTELDEAQRMRERIASAKGAIEGDRAPAMTPRATLPCDQIIFVR